MCEFSLGNLIPWLFGLFMAYSLGRLHYVLKRGFEFDDEHDDGPRL